MSKRRNEQENSEDNILLFRTDRTKMIEPFEKYVIYSKHFDTENISLNDYLPKIEFNSQLEFKDKVMITANLWYDQHKNELDKNNDYKCVLSLYPIELKINNQYLAFCIYRNIIYNTSNDIIQQELLLFFKLHRYFNNLPYDNELNISDVMREGSEFYEEIHSKINKNVTKDEYFNDVVLPFIHSLEVKHVNFIYDLFFLSLTKLYREYNINIGNINKLCNEFILSFIK